MFVLKPPKRGQHLIKRNTRDNGVIMDKKILLMSHSVSVKKISARAQITPIDDVSRGRG